MNKQRFISFPLLLAFALIFAHSIIPHHDQDDDVCTQRSTNPDQHSDVDHNFLGSAFANFQHEQGKTVTYETSTINCQCAKAAIFHNALVLLSELIQKCFQPPPEYCIQPNINFSSATIVAQQQFRGPPMFFMA